MDEPSRKTAVMAFAGRLVLCRVVRKSRASAYPLRRSEKFCKTGLIPP